MADTEYSLLFEVSTPLVFTVRCTAIYWQSIVDKHPVMAQRLEDVRATLSEPNEIRQSVSDANVLLFYRPDETRLVCAVARKLNGDGFLITAYPTDKMKNGETVWPK